MNLTTKKIALIIDSMYGGGAEKVALTLRRELERAGHEAHIIALENSGHYDARSEQHLHFLVTPTKHFMGRRAYARQAMELKARLAELERNNGRPFDLIVANLIHSQQVVARADLANAWYCVHASILGGLTQTLRRNPLQYWRQRRLQAVLNGKRVITVSRGLERELHECRWLSPASVRTIYNPLEFEEIRQRAAALDEPLPTEPYLLHVGRASHQKRIDVLFEALRESTNGLPLVMLTNHPDKVTKLARRMGVERRVHAVAFRQNPYPWMRNAKLVLLSSDYEGFPLVLVEALACGTPILSTDCPHGPAEILTGSLSHWLVPVGDPKALAQRMDEALSCDIDVSAVDVLHLLDAPTVAAQYATLV